MLKFLYKKKVYSNCHNPNSTSTQPQLNSSELGLTQKWVCTPPLTTTQTQLPSQGASYQPLKLPKQQHKH